MSGKYLMHNKTSFRKKYVDTFSAHRNSIMVLMVRDKNSSPKMTGLLLDRLSPYYVLENHHLGT